MYVCMTIFRKFKGQPYIGFYIGSNPGILVRDMELVQTVLIKDFRKFHDNAFFVDDEIDPILGKNPFVLRGEQWKIVRGQITSQFSSAKVITPIPQFITHGHFLIDMELNNIHVLYDTFCGWNEVLLTFYRELNCSIASAWLTREQYITDMQISNIVRINKTYIPLILDKGNVSLDASGYESHDKLPRKRTACDWKGWYRCKGFCRKVHNRQRSNLCIWP